MIAWTIPTSLTITGATTATTTSSSSNSFSNSFATTFTYSFTISEGGTFSSNSFTTNNSNSYSEYRSTVHGASGTTTYSFFSSEFSSFSESTVIYRDQNGSQTGGSASASGSFSTSDSSSGSTALPSYYVQTSTTKTVQQFVSDAVSSIQIEGTAYTTSKSAFSAEVEFVETSANVTHWYIAGQNKTLTQTTTTFLTQTTNAGAFATVVQADDSEILYFISNPQTNWYGYSVASEGAQSGSRFTVKPEFSLQSVETIEASITTTQSTSNQSNTFQLSWNASAEQTRAQTSVVAYWKVPNITESFVTTQVTTSQTTSSGIIFASESMTFGKVNEQVFATTSLVTSYATLPTKATRLHGSVVFEQTFATTTSATRLITTTRPATNATARSSSYAANGAPDDQTTTASGSTFSVEGVQTIYGPAQISTGIADPISRLQFATSGAIVGTQTGLWFTANETIESPQLQTAKHGSGRAGVTVLPTTHSLLTVASDSVTLQKTFEDQSDNTTITALLGVAGSSYTIEESVLTNDPVHFGGGLVGKGCTIVDVGGVGAYRNGINGNTTAFIGAATSMTEGDSQTVASWYPVTCITPLVLRANRHAITFSAARNSSQLPPSA